MSRLPRSAIWASESRVAWFRHRRGIRERRDLPAQRGDLLVEQFDLGQRLGGDLLFLVERGAQPGDGAARADALAVLAFEERREMGVLAFSRGEIVGQRRERRLELGLGGLLEREQLASVRRSARAVCQSALSWPEISRASRNCAIMNTDKQEGDDQQQLRHGIDEARPVGSVLLRGGGAESAAMRLLLVFDAPGAARRLARRLPPMASWSRRWISLCCVCCVCAQCRTIFCSSRICFTRVATAPASLSSDSHADRTCPGAQAPPRRSGW